MWAIAIMTINKEELFFNHSSYNTATKLSTVCMYVLRNII
jgi:hypothetical protein